MVGVGRHLHRELTARTKSARPPTEDALVVADPLQRRVREHHVGRPGARAELTDVAGLEAKPAGRVGGGSGQHRRRVVDPDRRRRARLGVQPGGQIAGAASEVDDPPAGHRSNEIEQVEERLGALGGELPVLRRIPPVGGGHLSHTCILSPPTGWGKLQPCNLLHPSANIVRMQDVAERLARVLDGWRRRARRPHGLRPAVRGRPSPCARSPARRAPADVWAVDGGQALVADARCLQVVVTRAARVRYRDGECVLEEEGELQAELLTDGSIINLLRDKGEWDAVERALDDAEPGALMLVDGDLQPDWRIPSTFLAELLGRGRGPRRRPRRRHQALVALAGRRAALLGHLEREAERRCSARGPCGGRRSPAPGPTCRVDLQVVAARLDPDAPFSFRIDLPGDVDPEPSSARSARCATTPRSPATPIRSPSPTASPPAPAGCASEAAGELDDALAALGVSARTSAAAPSPTATG